MNGELDAGRRQRGGRRGRGGGKDRSREGVELDEQRPDHVASGGGEEDEQGEGAAHGREELGLEQEMIRL